MSKDDGRILLPNLRLYPKVYEQLKRVADSAGYSVSYYILYLIGRELGYLPAKASHREVRRWLKDPDPQSTYDRHHRSRAGIALQQLGTGVHSTMDIARAAGIPYQRTYRQLRREPRATKTDDGWVWG